MTKIQMNIFWYSWIHYQEEYLLSWWSQNRSLDPTYGTKGTLQEETQVVKGNVLHCELFYWIIINIINELLLFIMIIHNNLQEHELLLKVLMTPTDKGL